MYLLFLISSTLRYFYNYIYRIKLCLLTVERISIKIIIRLPAGLEGNNIQRMSDYLSYKRAITKSQANPYSLFLNHVKLLQIPFGEF
jgi:hypothetical protein